MAHCGLVSALFLLAATGESFIYLFWGEISHQSYFILFILTLKLSPVALSKAPTTTIYVLNAFKRT